MNILYPAGVRREYFDRNPLVTNFYFELPNVAPHGNTNRLTYTVPANRRALICAAELDFFRGTAATTSGKVWEQLTIFDGSLIRGVIWITLFTNNIGDARQVVASNFGWLLAAQRVDINTQDASTGGVLDYRGSFQILEFDV